MGMSHIVMLDQLSHFDITQILESGQVFRFSKLSDHSYLLNARQKLIKITQQHHSSSAIFYNTSTSEVDQIWLPYFDISTDYEKIAHTLSEKDDFMREAIQFGKGIRILKQEPWEMLISFIISQNKAIPHIKQCISNISQRFGRPLEGIDEEQSSYTFPTPRELVEATEEELRECKVGFRAPYIKDACNKVVSGEVVLNDLYTMPTEEARIELMKIKGVGPKIADCILLFAYGKSEVFPTDVWIKRVIEGVYFKGKNVPLKEIQEFASSYFGSLAGYAQQYMFYYGREHALFK